MRQSGNPTKMPAMTINPLHFCFFTFSFNSGNIFGCFSTGLKPFAFTAQVFQMTGITKAGTGSRDAELKKSLRSGLNSSEQGYQHVSKLKRFTLRLPKVVKQAFQISSLAAETSGSRGTRHASSSLRQKKQKFQYSLGCNIVPQLYRTVDDGERDVVPVLNVILAVEEEQALCLLRLELQGDVNAEEGSHLGEGKVGELRERWSQEGHH